MPVDLEQFLRTFHEESAEGLQLMESGLLELDAGALDPEQIDAIFRAAHSIKGGAGTFGLGALADFTHLVETLLDEIRQGTRPITTPVRNLLLESVDGMRDMLSAAQAKEPFDAQSVSGLQRRLESQLHGAAPAPAAADDAPPAIASRGVGWHIGFRPHPHLLQTGNEPVRMLRELQALSEAGLDASADLSRLPPFAELAPEECHLGWDLTLHGDIPRAAVEEIFEWVEGDCDLQITAIAPAEAPAPGITGHLDTTPAAGGASGNAAPAAKRGAASTGESGSIRVDVDKIDALINVVGELVITQSMLGQLGEDFAAEKLEQLREGLMQLERNTREIQENVMRIRMLPISFAFNRFPRLVHDLSQTLVKQVELSMSGESTELDKTVLEKISDPLVHLVRNALDHGLEVPEERRRAGKPETGTVHLAAFHQGGNIIIEISDDGRGIDVERVLRKARERGVLGPAQTPPVDEIHDLLFHPGFSTADAVTDVSGRGVGLDVVRRNIRDLGGSVELSSTPGKGSKFRIRLPLTLAILDGQLVQVGGEVYIIPLVSIIETVQIRQERLNVLAGKAEVYKLRGDYIPVVRLRELFGLDDTSDVDDLSTGLLVVVEGDGRKAGLLVNDLLSQQQVVIKSLETNLKRVEGVSGATILGDGAVSLILDVPGLIQLSHNQAGGAKLRPPRACDAVA